MINTNRLHVPQPIIPIGLCMVASAAEARGHVVRISDICFAHNSQSQIRSDIRKFVPDVIGLSIRNLDNSDASSPKSYLPHVKVLMQTIRECSSAPIIIGGSAVSIAPNDISNYLSADYAIGGEGETAFTELLDRLSGFDTPVHEQNVDSLQPSNTLGYMRRQLDLMRYADYGVSAPIQTKRGCGQNCVYCTYPQIEGHEYRLRTPIAVADEVVQIQSMNIFDSIEFVDSVFNHPCDHTLLICEELIRRQNRMPLHTSSINPSHTSVRLFRMMESAGFCGIASSLESASDDVLGNLKKGYTAKDIVNTVQAARHTSMARMWLFLFGGPGETEKTVSETLTFIRKYMDSRDLVFITRGLRIYPGTELARIALREGIIDHDSDLLMPAFYFSPKITEERLFKMIREADLPRGTVFMSDMDWASLPIMQRMYSILHLRPPYWRHARTVMQLKRMFETHR